MRRGQRENATSAGRKEGESVVVDKADRSCREGWWRASSNRVGNEERQQRRRQQRRHPLYSHEHVHTHMHSRTHASTYRHTSERASERASSLTPFLHPSLLSSYLFLGLFILLTLRSDHPLLAVSLTIFLCTFTLFSPPCRLSPFLPFLSSFSLPLLTHLRRRPRAVSPPVSPRTPLCYNVAALGARRHRWLRLCTAGTYYSACAARYALLAYSLRRRFL